MNRAQRISERASLNIAFLVVPVLLLFVLSLAPTSALADGVTIGDSGCGPVSVTSGGTTASCTVSAGPFDTTTTNAFGDLSTGRFGAEATVVQAGCGLPCGASISQFVEVTYLFSGLGISSGAAQIGLTANGTLSDPLAAADFEVSASESLIGPASLPSGMTSLAVDTPITNGSAILNFTLLVSAVCNAGGSCTSQSDFYDPLTITGATAFDANGNAVSATFVSESGFNPNAVPAPEPSSLMLLGSGLLGLIGFSLKKASA